jgi:hypothetical protein
MLPAQQNGQRVPRTLNTEGFLLLHPK